MPLVDYVQKYNPIQQTPFRQAESLSEVGATGPNIEGKCYAFALAYLLVLRLGAAGKDLLESLNIAAKTKDTHVINEIMGQSKELMGTDKWVGTDFFNLQSSSQRRDEVFQAFKLKPETEVRFSHKNKKFEDLAQFIGTDTPTYSLLDTPNHALAAASLPGGRRVWCFFDPNLGEAEFGTQVDLRLCIANFFANKTVKKHYKRQEIGAAKSGPIYERQKLEMVKMTVDVVRCIET